MKALQDYEQLRVSTVGESKMSKWKCRMVAAGLALLAAGAIMPVQAHTPDDAKALAEKAAALIAAEGDKAFAKIGDRNGEFVQGDLVVTVLDQKAVVLAHFNPKLVGMDTWEITDPDGVKFGQNSVNIAASTGSGWTSFKFVNPVTKKIEPTKAWVLKAGDFVIVSAISSKE